MKTRWIRLVTRMIVIILIGIIIIFPLFSQQMQDQFVKIDKDLTIVMGGGGNSGILNTDKAVVVIDTKSSGPDAAQLYELARKTAGTKQIIVINTHYHGDHVGGNQFYKGSKIYIGDYDLSFLQNNVKPEDMPTDFVKDSLTLDLGNEKLLLVNMGAGHTYKDMVVYLENRKILFSGDLVVNKVCPYVLANSGANVDRWISDLNVILARWDIKTIIPGHGNVGDRQIASNMKKYFEDMKLAASDPSKASELTAKYKDWKVSPGWASTEKTIEFIKSH